jgi:hypothetical protein
MPLQEMKISQLLELRMRLQQQFQRDVQANRIREKWLTLNHLRVVNAELEVARCERRI